MSYARWGSGSAVYVYADVDGGVVCCGCSLVEGEYEEDFTDFFGEKHKKGDPLMFGPTLYFYSAEELIAHLEKHVEADQPVPDELFNPATYIAEDFERQ